jgi:hypothetical protein
VTGWILVPSPATGPLVWQGVATQLRAAGHEAGVADLRDTLTAEPGWAQRQVDAVVAQSTVDGPYVVVGHSAAGALLPAIGAALGEVAAYLFVDAVLPRPGRTFADVRPELMDFIGSKSADGVWTSPWHTWWDGALQEGLPDADLLAAFEAECRPLPIAMFREPGPVAEAFPDAPCGYVRFTESYDLDAPAQLGWRVVDRPGDHLDMMIDPVGVTGTLLALVEEIAANVPRMSEETREFTPDRSKIDLSRDPTPGKPDHLAPDDAGERPFIDLSRDPNPGRPAHAAPEDDDDAQ